MADVHVVAHTHWDREWYLTREQYRARLVDLVDRVLDRMEADPAFTSFHLDGQTIVIEDYLEIRPGREQEMRDRIAEGRLLVGPWYVMPDMFLVSGEAIVRNLALGLRIGDGFGGAMRVGYMPDPFGHLAQMPQILSGFGLEGAILWRGFGGPRAEYIWESPDGSRVHLLHLPREGYCNGLRLPMLPPDRMGSGAASVVAREQERSATGQVLLMVGVDHVEPHPSLPLLVDVINDLPGTTARLSTLPAYVAAATAADERAAGGLEVVCGELRGGEDYAHLLPGVMSARTWLKQANARVQRELERWAEPASVFASMCGAAPDIGLLRRAWKTLLENHPHDSICGCSIDAVHKENRTRFATAGQTAATVTERAARAIGARLPPAPPGAVRALVLNTDAAPWSGVVEATVEIPLEPARPDDDLDWSLFDGPVEFFGPTAVLSGVTDSRGRPMAFQVLDVAETTAQRMSAYLPPVTVRVSRVRLALDARDVPALGYAVVDFHVTKEPTPSPPPAGHAASRGATSGAPAIDNGVIRVEARADGAVDVTDRRSGVTYHGAFALEDVGDVGDEYTYAAPTRDRRVTHADARDVRVQVLDDGPLSTTLGIAYQLPVPAAADRAASADENPPGARARASARSAATVDIAVDLALRLRAGSPLVDATIRVDNRACDHRLRVLVPTGAAAVASHRADTAFGIVERPARRAVPSGPLVETPSNAAPMQSVVDAGDDRVGAVVVTDGLVEYEIVDGVDGAAIAVTLLRAVGDLSRDDLSTRRGHAGPPLPTPGAQCLGEHEFRLAFVPRATPPAAASLFRAARGCLAMPRLFAPCGGSGALPPEASFLRIATSGESHVVLSACKPAEDRPSVLVRVFNAGAVAEEVTISTSGPVQAAYLTDLAERRREACAIGDAGVSIAMAPFRVETIELVPL